MPWPRLTLLAALVALLVLGYGALSVSAQETSVIETGATPAYPDGIDFNVSYTGGGQVDRTSLLYQATGLEAWSLIEGTPTDDDSATASLDATSEFVPLGISIQYRWEVTLDSGEEIESETRTVEWRDSRFDWREATSGSITVYTNGASDGFRESILDSAVETVEALSPRYDLSEVEPVRIWIYNSAEDFAGTLMSNSQGWIGGASYPEFRLIVTAIEDGNRGEVNRIIPHEMSHQLLAQATDNPFNGPALWIDEGLAVLSQPGSLQRYHVRVQEARSEDRLVAIRALNSTFPVDAGEASLAYAQSMSVMSYIIATYGEESITEIVQAYRAGNAHEDVIRMSIGVSIDQLDADWRSWLEAQPSATGNRSLARTLLYGAPAVGVLAYLVGRRFVRPPQYELDEAA